MFDIPSVYQRLFVATLFVIILPASAARHKFPASPDFIIVGAGTAGNVVAARLCKSLPKATILILERGEPRNETTEFLVRASRNAGDAWNSPLVSEIYGSLPNPGLGGRKSTITTGRTLGGTSSTNGAQFTIPVGNTVDRWRIMGLTSPKSKRLYRRVFKTLGVAEQPNKLNPIHGDEFVKAADEVGFRRETDPFMTGVRRGIWPNRVAGDRSGRRIDSFTGYLKPLLRTKCKGMVQLLLGVTVTRIILSKGDEKVVEGVEYVHSGDIMLRKKKFVRAKEEVIVSTGPFQSPKLLQLSGIGTPSVLRAAGVKPLVNLPVGEQTQARAASSFSVAYSLSLEPANNKTILESIEAREMFRKGRGGVYGTSYSSHNGPVNQFGYIVTFFVFNQVPPNELFNRPVFISACAGNPKSFGFVHIRNSNPFVPPDVHTNVLGDQSDVKGLLKCMKTMEPIHLNLPKQLRVSVNPPRSALTEEFIRQNSAYGLHFVGGCRVDDVVKRNLVVKGVRKLRVIDASVLKRMPTSSGPLASVYMIAEHASDMLSTKYACKFGSMRACRASKSKPTGW